MLYNLYYKEFEKTHKNELNIYIHLFSLILGTYSIINLLPYSNIFCMIYLFSLHFVIPYNLLYETISYITIILLISKIYIININQSLYLLLFSFLLNEFSHILTNEKTMLSNYITFNLEGIKKYIIHTYLLIPIILNINNETNYENILSNNNINFCILESTLTKQMDFLYEYIIKLNISNENTTHIWYSDLNNLCKLGFLNIIKSKNIYNSLFVKYNKNMYNIENITQMDELYVSSFNDKYNSDKVFYSEHIDGPFGLLPGITINRTIIALSYNEYINTVFPDNNININLNKGMCISFDFNRSIHYIKQNEDKIKPIHRIVIKAHYLIYPKNLKYYAKLCCKLNVLYDKLARKLFLYTLNPNTHDSKLMTYIILKITNNWFLIERYLGLNNISYTSVIIFLSYLFNNYFIFLFYILFMYYYNIIEKNKDFYKYIILINIIYNLYYII